MRLLLGAQSHIPGEATGNAQMQLVTLALELPTLHPAPA